MLIVGGRREATPFRSENWEDRPALRLSTPEDGRLRPEGAEIRAVVAHSTKGWPTGKHPEKEQRVLPGSGPPGAGVRVFAYWREHFEHAGAHVTVDPDGTVCQGADLLTEMAFHAGSLTVNSVTIGVEIYQGDEGEFYDGQLDAWADLCLWLCQRFGLPLRAQFGYPRKGGRPVPNAPAMRGVYGHRDCSANRGWGDPGDAVFLRLRDRSGFFLGDISEPPSPEPAPTGTFVSSSA